MLIDNLEKLPREFKDGYRGVLFILRNKDGLIGNAQRKSFKRISSNIDEFNEIVNHYRYLQSHGYEKHRIYSSVNGRDIKKSIREFKRRQLEADFGSEENRNFFYSDIKNTFFSCLMNPSSRTENNFLIDCDSEEEYHFAKNVLPESHIILDYETKNGRHLITHPFNPNEIRLKPKKDDMIFIG